MPNAAGKLNFADFVNDLKQRGFDGFSPEELNLIVNQAYMAVAKKSRWEWEKTTAEFQVSAGTPWVSVEAGNDDLPNFGSIDRIYKTDPGYEVKLQIMGEDDFFQHWLGRDYTQQHLWNEQTRYFLYDHKLWLLSPSTYARNFVAYYTQIPAYLITPFDFPITPQHLDEAIINAARVRAHTRSNEPTLSAIARTDLEESFDDMRDDEEEDMHELQERVSPDRTWY